MSIALLALLACSGKAVPDAPPPSEEAPAQEAPAEGATTEEAPAEEAPAEAATAPVVGSWHDLGCEGRSYGRQLDFSKDGSFVALELIAPCPQGAACVWSGIIERPGTWTSEGLRLSLAESADAPASGPGADQLTPLPAALLVQHDLLADKDGGCAYRRGPAPSTSAPQPDGGRPREGAWCLEPRDGVHPGASPTGTMARCPPSTASPVPAPPASW